MYYVIGGLPLAIVFCLLQYFLCIKAKKKWVKFIPAMITGAAILAFFVLIIDEVNAAIGNLIGWGVFALIVYVAIFGIGAIIGTAAGWIVYCIKNARKSA